MLKPEDAREIVLAHILQDQGLRDSLANVLNSIDLSNLYQALNLYADKVVSIIFYDKGLSWEKNSTISFKRLLEADYAVPVLLEFLNKKRVNRLFDKQENAYLKKKSPAIKSLSPLDVCDNFTLYQSTDYFKKEEPFNYGEVFIKFLDSVNIVNQVKAWRVSKNVLSLSYIVRRKLEQELEQQDLKKLVRIRSQVVSAFDSYLQAIEHYESLQLKLQLPDRLMLIGKYLAYKIELFNYLNATESLMKELQKAYFYESISSDDFLFNVALHQSDIDYIFTYEIQLLAQGIIPVKFNTLVGIPVCYHDFYSYSELTQTEFFQMARNFLPHFHLDHQRRYRDIDFEQLLLQGKAFSQVQLYTNRKLSDSADMDAVAVYAINCAFHTYHQALVTKLLRQEQHCYKDLQDESLADAWYDYFDLNLGQNAFDRYQALCQNDLLQTWQQQNQQVALAYKQLCSVTDDAKELLTNRDQLVLDKFIVKARVKLYRAVQDFLNTLGTLLADIQLSVAEENLQSYHDLLLLIHHALYSYSCYYLIENNSWNESSFNGYKSAALFKESGQYQRDMFAHPIFKKTLIDNCNSVFHYIYDYASYQDYSSFKVNCAILKGLSLPQRPSFAALLHTICYPEFSDTATKNLLPLSWVQNHIALSIIFSLYNALKQYESILIEALLSQIYKYKTFKAVKPYIDPLARITHCHNLMQEINIQHLEGLVNINTPSMLTRSMLDIPEIKEFLSSMLAMFQALEPHYEQLDLAFADLMDIDFKVNAASCCVQCIQELINYPIMVCYEADLQLLMQQEQRPKSNMEPISFNESLSYILYNLQYVQLQYETDYKNLEKFALEVWDRDFVAQLTFDQEQEGSNSFWLSMDRRLAEQILHNKIKLISQSPDSDRYICYEIPNLKKRSRLALSGPPPALKFSSKITGYLKKQIASSELNSPK